VWAANSFTTDYQGCSILTTDAAERFTILNRREPLSATLHHLKRLFFPRLS